MYEPCYCLACPECLEGMVAVTGTDPVDVTECVACGGTGRVRSVATTPEDRLKAKIVEQLLVSKCECGADHACAILSSAADRIAALELSLEQHRAAMRKQSEALVLSITVLHDIRHSCEISEAAAAITAAENLMRADIAKAS